MPVCLQLVEVVCCKMTEMQRDLYNHFLESKATARLLAASEGGGASKGGTRVLGAITALKKLCNHPKLIYDVVHGNNEKAKVDGFKGCEKFFLPGANPRQYFIPFRLSSMLQHTVQNLGAEVLKPLQMKQLTYQALTDSA